MGGSRTRGQEQCKGINCKSVDGRGGRCGSKIESREREGGAGVGLWGGR